MQENKNFLTDKLVITSNNLQDVINWLELGAYVVVHTNSARFFHKCTKKILSDDEIKEYINTHRIIYVNVSKLPGLLDDGEWNWYIKNAGFDECECCIKKRASDMSLTFPYSTKLSLGI